MDNIQEYKENRLVFTGFWLKLIALISMTMDHVGYYILSSGFKDGAIYYIAWILRSLGRLALPLFCFGVAEGVKHTKNIWKYTLKLGIMFAVMLISYIIVEFVPAFKEHGIVLPRMGIIFIDLLLGALGAYALKNKKAWIKCLAILPIIYGVLCYAINCYEYQTNILVYWLPYYLRTESGWKGIFMIICFSLSETLTGLFYKQQENTTGINPELIKGTTQDQFVNNIVASLIIILMELITFAVSFITPTYDSSYTNVFALLACIFIILYNGKRGYNKKWFTHGCYLYYPVHFILIFVIFELIFML